jgi:hypothetical protein
MRHAALSAAAFACDARPCPSGSAGFRAWNECCSGGSSFRFGKQDGSLTGHLWRILCTRFRRVWLLWELQQLYWPVARLHRVVAAEEPEAAIPANTPASRRRAKRSSSVTRTSTGERIRCPKIGDMDLALQKKLLRVLATGETRAVGSDTVQRSNARIVAATNVDLQAAVAQGRFRADLHARLLAHCIELAPLRARREDILPLARHFCAAARLRLDFSADAAEALLLHAWPYNVRELEQLLSAAAPELASQERLELSHLPDRLQTPIASRAACEGPVALGAASPLLGIRRNAVPNRDELVRLLEVYRGNMSLVAKFLGRGRRQIYRWVQRYDVDPARYRSSAGDEESECSSSTRVTSPPPEGSSGTSHIRKA